MFEAFQDVLKPGARLVGMTPAGVRALAEIDMLPGAMSLALTVGDERWQGTVVGPLDIEWQRWPAAELWLLEVKVGRMVRHDGVAGQDGVAFHSPQQHMTWAVEEGCLLCSLSSTEREGWTVRLAPEWEYVLKSVEPQPLGIAIGSGLMSLTPRLSGRLEAARLQLQAELGIAIPKVRVWERLHLGSRYSVRVYDEEVASLEVEPGPGGDLLLEQVASSVADVVRTHAWRFLGGNATQALLDPVGQTHAELVRGVMRSLTLAELQSILQTLLRGQIPLTPVLAIFEVLTDSLEQTKAPKLLVEALRIRLRREALGSLLGPDRQLSVMTIDPALETQFINRELTGTQLTRLRQSIQSELRRIGPDIRPALLLSPAATAKVRAAVLGHIDRAPVLSWDEIPADIPVNPISVVPW